MATQEFYIRHPSETEAHGPFNNEHIISLAETGQLTRETLYYDAAKEQWAPVAENAELCAIAFPQKTPIKLQTNTKLKTLNVADPGVDPISVDDMLAAAEGRTADTKDKLDPAKARARSAAIGLYSTIILLFISAAALALPAIDVLIALDPIALIHQPVAVLGILQAALAIILILQVTQAYQLVRFSCSLGIGLVGFILWSRGQTVPLTTYIIGSVGLYFSTVFTNLAGIGIATGLGFVGLAGYAFFALSS